MKPKVKPCEVKTHFDCNGTGQVCEACLGDPDTCSCDDDLGTVACEDCDGAGRICVEHDSPCGDTSKPPLCDAAKALLGKKS
jgi:hypothetical protein